MFNGMKRTINFEVVKTPPAALSDLSQPTKTPRTTDEIVQINAIIVTNARYAAVGLVSVYAAIKAIDTAGKIAIIKAMR